MAGWKPKYKTLDETLTAEFPDYIREPIAQWVKGVTGAGWGNESIKPRLYLSFQARMREDFGWRQGNGTLSWSDSVFPKLLRWGDALFTDFLDYIVYSLGDFELTYLNEEWEEELTQQGKLEVLLSDASSKWRVGQDEDGNATLVERVPQAMQSAFEVATNRSSAPSKLLARAWVEAYGVNPNPSEAFNSAVKAVESATIPKFPRIKKPDPTLGDVISQLGNQSSGFSLPFRDSEKVSEPDAMQNLLRLIWNGHGDRHGCDDYKDATLDQARAAVLIAVTVVSLFEGGMATVVL